LLVDVERRVMRGPPRRDGEVKAKEGKEGKESEKERKGRTPHARPAEEPEEDGKGKVVVETPDVDRLFRAGRGGRWEVREGGKGSALCVRPLLESIVHVACPSMPAGQGRR
jgi:hypothetical protein